MQETIVDPRLTTAEEHAEGVRQAQVLFYRFNIEVQHCYAKIVKIFVSVKKSSKVFWVGG